MFGVRESGKDIQKLIDVLIFLLVALLCQVGILRIWFDSKLFQTTQAHLNVLKADPGLRGFVAKMATCWQCSGIWTGWLVCFTMSACIPASPIPWYSPVNLFLGVAVGFLSECVETFVVSKLTSYAQEVETEEQDEEIS